MQKILIIVALLLGVTLLLLGCEQNSVNTDNLELSSQESDNYTLIMDEEVFNALEGRENAEVSEEFEITDVSRTEKDGKNYLRIKVLHQSCDPETRIVWDGRIAQLRGQPPHIYLIVQLLATEGCQNDPKTEEQATEVFLLDLYEQFDKEIADHADFIVRNASSFEGENEEEREVEFPMPSVPHDPSDGS